jgi:hypothetical protein
VINRVVFTSSASPPPKRGALETLPSISLVTMSVGTGLLAAFITGLL